MALLFRDSLGYKNKVCRFRAQFVEVSKLKKMRAQFAEVSKLKKITGMSIFKRVLMTRRGQNSAYSFDNYMIPLHLHQLHNFIH